MPSIKLNGRTYAGGGCSHLFGTTEPVSSLGVNGDMYTQYNSSGIIAVYEKINGVWLPFPSGGGGSYFRRLVITEGVQSSSEITITGEVEP